MRSLKAGDVVRHKSGGQRMVVTEAHSKSRWGYNYDVAICEWITRKGERRREVFNPSVLEAAESAR